MRTRGGAFGTEGVLGGYGGKGMAVGAIAAAAVFHGKYQPAVGCFGEGGIGLEYFHRCHGNDVAAAVGDGLAAEDGFVQQGCLNFGFVGGFRSELIWASNLSSRWAVFWLFSILFSNCAALNLTNL